MFFYLIQHSTIIEKELDNNTKMTKIFLYGGISYIILHATLFIGGKDALLYSLKSYFWLFFILDIITIFLVNNKNIDLNVLLDSLKHKLMPKKIKPISLKNKKNKKNNFENKVEKKVHFAEDNEYTSDSDSDSDIGTDVDFEEFKHSLNL